MYCRIVSFDFLDTTSLEIVEVYYANKVAPAQKESGLICSISTKISDTKLVITQIYKDKISAVKRWESGKQNFETLKAQGHKAQVEEGPVTHIVGNEALSEIVKLTSN